MAITGTKAPNTGGMKPYFVNKCYIVGADQVESQYSDTTLKLTLEDSENGYKYVMFINQNFEKDKNGVVTDLKFPDNVNTLYLAAEKDLNIDDVGEITNLEDLANAKVACISYPCTGKYKRAIWSTVSSWDTADDLSSNFDRQLEKGYPKNYQKSSNSTGDVTENDLPF